MKNSEHYARIETLESFVYKTQPINLFTLPKQLNYKDGIGIAETTVSLPSTNYLFQKISFDKPFIPIGIHHITPYLLDTQWAPTIIFPQYVFKYKGITIITESDIDIDTNIFELDFNKTIHLLRYKVLNNSALAYKWDYPINEMMLPGEYIFGMPSTAYELSTYPEFITIKPFEFHYLQKQ